MKILVSGGAGFIGSHTVKLLTDRGHQVCVVDNFSTGRPGNLHGCHAQLKPVSITDFKLLSQCFYDFEPDAVLHLAAQSAITTSQEKPQLDLKINGIGTLNMLVLSITHNVKKFVFSSTSAVYDESKLPFWINGMNEKHPKNPESPYGISKLTAEFYIRSMFPNHIILRYGNVYGERQVPIGENQVIARAFNHFIHGENFKVHGSGNQKRDYVHVSDIAYCNMVALTSLVSGTFNAATGKSHSVNEMLAKISKFYEVPNYRWEHTNREDPRGDVHINCNAIYDALGWKASLNPELGISRTAGWWKK